MSGKVLIQWRHSLCAEVAKLRYIPSREVCRQAHAELANIFFVGEANEDTDEVTSSHSGGGGVGKLFCDLNSLQHMSLNLSNFHSKHPTGCDKWAATEQCSPLGGCFVQRAPCRRILAPLDAFRGHGQTEDDSSVQLRFPVGCGELLFMSSFLRLLLVSSPANLFYNPHSSLTVI